MSTRLTLCLMSAHGYPLLELTRPSWCEAGVRRWSEAKRGTGRQMREGPDVPFGRPRTVLHLVLPWNGSKGLRTGQHIVALYVLLWKLPLHWSTWCFFFQTWGGGKGGIGVQGQIMSSLCWNLGEILTWDTVQWAVCPFIWQTGNIINCLVLPFAAIYGCARSAFDK